jgi:hypothetical protein
VAWLGVVGLDAGIGLCIVGPVRIHPVFDLDHACGMNFEPSNGLRDLTVVPA